MKYIGITGSKVIPFLTDVSRDTDILIICSNKEEYDNIKNKINNIKIPGITVIVTLFNENDKLISYWSYLYRYLITIYKEDNYTLEDIDILKDNYKSMYIESCRSYISRGVPIYKNWYHLLVGMYILKNKSYDLTKNQINNIRLAHSWSIPEDLKDEIIDFFNKKEDI